MKRIVAGVALLALAGCAAPHASVSEPPITRMPFPTAEYERLRVDGTATVKGGAFLRTREGEVKTAAGQEVHLLPKTSYTDEWYAYYLDGKILRNDPLMMSGGRITLADASGNFEFSGVGAGRYYLVTNVRWQVYVQGYYSYWAPQGGTLAREIQVPEGQTVNVVMTQ